MDLNSTRTKKRTGFLALLVLGFLITEYVFLSNRESSPAPESGETKEATDFQHSEKTPSSPGSLLTLRGLITSPLPKTAIAIPEGTSPECAAFQTELLSLSLSDIGYPPKADHLPSPSGCSPSSPRVAKLLKNYSEKCAGTFESIPKDRKASAFTECQIATVLLRSVLTAESREKRPLEEIEDLRELADLLVGEFSDIFMGASPESARELVAIADRMSKLDPNLLAAAKAGAIGSILELSLDRDAAEREGQKAPPPDWKAIQDRVRRIEELNPNDAELDSYRRVVDTEIMTPELVKKDSLARLEKNPDAWFEHELVAWADFKAGRRREARAALSRALSLQPNHPELRKNWAVVNRPDSKPSDFKVAIKMGLNLDDLLK